MDNKAWATRKLSDIGEIVGGATPSTNIEEYYGGNIPWITPKDLSNFDGRYISRGERNITRQGLQNCSAKLVPKNTILFTSRAPIGYIAIAQNEVCTNQGFKSIVPSDKVDPIFLYYLLVSNKSKIESLGSGTTFKEVSGSTMKNIEVYLPNDIKEQKAIAEILSSIDDRIELNSQINKKLEEIAQALFRRWFVDFEFPDENGNPYKSSGGEMVESELGLIPKGWCIKTIGNITEIIRGASPRPIQEFLRKEGMPWIKISDATASESKYLMRTVQFIKKEGIDKSRTVIPGTLILSNSATPGLPMITAITACVHDGWLVFNNYRNVSKEYFYYYLVNERNNIVSLSNGSVFNNLKTDILKSYKIAIPSAGLMKKATGLFISINKRILESMSEIYELECIRDFLLPKLMSGEIRVPVEEA